jgi:hypothetical protein
MSEMNEFAQHLVTSCLLDKGTDALEGRLPLIEVPVEDDPARMVEVVQERVGMAYLGGMRAVSALTVVAGRHGLDRDDLLREALNLLAERD